MTYDDYIAQQEMGRKLDADILAMQQANANMQEAVQSDLNVIAKAEQIKARQERDAQLEAQANAARDERKGVR